MIIAGPNGAGKTTFAREFLPGEADLPDFVNADMIAAGLAPFRPERAAIRAGRLMLQIVDELVDRGLSFSFETTLSGHTYAHRIPRWRQLGYHVKIVYLSVQKVDVAIARVRVRASQGGHSVPEDVIRRRFATSWRNFTDTYRKMVDSWVLFDNSGPVPVLTDWSEARGC